MIEAQALSRRFGTFTAVSQISLRVEDGSVLALLGPNGAGKTTTVRMLAGLLSPSEGQATVAGYDIRREPDAVRANVGLVTDVPGLFEQMTVSTYLDFFGRIYGMPAERRSRQIAELLDLFDLAEHRKEKIAGFSKGMKQKVALARALIHDPAVLFLDEPTSGLDPLSARAVRELIMRLKHASRSIILCTHDLDEAERLADIVAIVRRGHLVACDAPTVLRQRASSETAVKIEFAQPFPTTLDALLSVEDAHAPRLFFNDRQVQVLEYLTPYPTQVNPRVLAALITAGAQIVAVACEHSSLEDVYISAMARRTGELDQSEGVQEPMPVLAQEEK